MPEIITHITDARNTGTINVYAVRYNQRGRNDNVAVALPGNLNFDLRDSFCENVINYQNAREVAFNPTSDGLEDNTYEFIPLENVREKWNEIKGLLDSALDYHGAENKRKVPLSNLFVCALDYRNDRYYLCAKQGKNSDKLLQGKIVFMEHQDELRVALPDEVFLMGCYVGFLIDDVENKVLIFDKKTFQDVFKYDDYQRETVQRNIAIVDQWHFLASSELIKSKCSQKNVYRNLAKVFADQEYMEQIRRTAPAQLKNNLLTRSPENFTENDFDGEQLVVTVQNLDTVMKMLAKGFKFNFFTNVAEQQ